VLVGREPRGTLLRALQAGEVLVEGPEGVHAGTSLLLHRHACPARQLLSSPVKTRMPLPNSVMHMVPEG